MDGARAKQELRAAIEELHLQGPYFVEERLTRQRGRFLRAVKDVPPGGSWWEIHYYFAWTGGSRWAYLPESRQTDTFSWGHTLHQAYLNAMLTLAG